MKKFSLFLLVAVLLVILCACGEKKSPEVSGEAVTPSEVSNSEESNSEVTETSTDIETPELPIADAGTFAQYRVTYNGVEFGVGDAIADIREKLGTETTPPETFKPCAAMVEGEVTAYVYEGIRIETNDKGLIYSIGFSTFENPGTSAAFVNGIKIGSTPAEVKEAFGVTDAESEYNITYNYSNLYVGIGLDAEGTGNVNYVSIEANV